MFFLSCLLGVLVPAFHELPNYTKKLEITTNLIFSIPLILNMEINIYINPDEFQVMNFHRRLEETSFKSF